METRGIKIPQWYLDWTKKAYISLPLFVDRGDAEKKLCQFEDLFDRYRAIKKSYNSCEISAEQYREEVRALGGQYRSARS